VDCILVNPLHPYTIDRRENFKLIFAEGVNAAIEVKPDISQREELHRALEQGLTVKALRRAETALAMPEREGEEAVEYSLRVPYFVFAMKAKADPLARIIHERFMGLCSAHRKTDEHAANVAESLHYQLDTLEIEFPLFIYKNSAFVNNPG
jgi:hypothetical protein